MVQTKRNRNKKLRRGNRKIRRTNPIRNIASKVHYFKRTSDFNSTNWTFVNGTQNGETSTKTVDGFYISTGSANSSNFTYVMASQMFTLDMLPDVSDFLNLFDQYKIISCKVSLRPWQTTVFADVAKPTNGALNTIVYSVLDYDDNATLTANNLGVQKMREYQTFKETIFLKNKPVVRSIKPHIAMAAYGAGVFTSYANTKAGWIDMASPSVSHYGMKFMFETFCPDAALTHSIWFRPSCEIVFAVKQAR